ncbi:antitoxin family protein [Promineifilum sp.]|uniref:antitoxin family protein n=1 Tax=Promineifilum sp. TaxID=2664178 RepID=UPI0035AF73F0
MTETITAIYENGVLRPLKPLKLKERQRVELQVVETRPASESEEREQLIAELVAAGLIEPHTDVPEDDPVSAERRAELARLLGSAPGKPLSEIIIEERGEW